MDKCLLEQRIYERRALADARAAHKKAPYACVWSDGMYHVGTGLPFDERECKHIPPPIGADCAIDCGKLGAGCLIHYANGVAPQSISYHNDNCEK